MLNRGLGELARLLSRALRDPGAGWSVEGVMMFGHAPGEAAEMEGPRLRATARGAIRLDRLERVAPVAYETVSRRPERWGQGVALCLPQTLARRPRRWIVTELGPDRGAVRPQDRDGVLFDLGLGLAGAEICVRGRDRELLAALRAGAARPLRAPGNPALEAILALGPQQVAITALGRCEVFAPGGGPGPEGLSPDFLRRGGPTPERGAPEPDGLAPCLRLRPPSPVAGPGGEDRPFDPALFEDFQTLLERWGPPGYLEIKREVWAALDAGVDPEDWRPPVSRTGRIALRNALRQRARMRPRDPALPAWLRTFEYAGEARAQART
ncbi:MAG: DUF6925 family protein [Pseudomonadota bacterium]